MNNNIFNILFVVGVSALITPVAFAAEFIKDSVVAIAAAVLLFVCVCNKKRELNRIGGIIMLVCYAVYFAYILIANYS